jgi:hypothetical protein
MITLMKIILLLNTFLLFTLNLPYTIFNSILLDFSILVF